MNVSEERLQEIVNAYIRLGDEIKVANAEGIRPSSVERMLREAKTKGIEGMKEIKEEPPKLPRIFIMDIENSPTLAAVWGMWKQNINLAAISEEWYLLSWAGKYLFETEVYSDVLTPEEAIEGNDKRVMESLWQHLEYADIVIGHNMQQFDALKANTRFVVNGIMPPSPYQIIDTLLAARKQFAFTSNKLDYLCQQFGVSRKADNGGMERWMGCLKGNPQDLLDMETYNRQDIVATEELYLAMRPYIKNHPNLGLYMESEHQMCYKCGSENIKWLYDDNGDPVCYATSVNRYHTYRCNECQSIGRSRHSIFSREDKKHLTSPIAR